MHEEQPPPTPDPLAEALLPVLVHRMNNSTQLLSNLRTVLQAAPGRDWLTERSEDLADAHGELRITGYLLALVSCACGADLLLERREGRGLVWLLRAVGEVVRREGGRLTEPPSGFPEVAPAASSWELLWLVGRLVHGAGRRAAAEGGELVWALEAPDGAAAVLRISPGPRGGEVPVELVERIPGAELVLSDEDARLSLPPGVLVTGA